MKHAYRPTTQDGFTAAEIALYEADDAANDAAGVGDLDSLPFVLSRNEPHEHVARSSSGIPTCYACGLVMERVGQRIAWTTPKRAKAKGNGWRCVPCGGPPRDGCERHDKVRVRSARGR